MRLALSWGIQASHGMRRFIDSVSFETPYTTSFSGLFCTTKGARLMFLTPYSPDFSPLEPFWFGLCRRFGHLRLLIDGSPELLSSKALFHKGYGFIGTTLA